MAGRKSIRTFKEIRNAKVDDLIELHDHLSTTMNVILSNPELQFYREEIFRRERRKQNDRMELMTKQMRNMTICILVLTVLNVVIVGFSICS
jgi:hypothetical protein